MIKKEYWIISNRPPLGIYTALNLWFVSYYSCDHEYRYSVITDSKDDAIAHATRVRPDIEIRITF